MPDFETFYIPKHLDAPGRWFLWTIDEAFSLLFPLFFGFALGHFILGVVLGSCVFLGWKRLKGTGQINLAFYGLYWFFPAFFSNLKSTPPSYYRFYVG